MPGTISRRKLLRAGGQAIVAGGAAVCAGSTVPAVASSRPKVKGVDYYQKLGVTPFINAGGTYTVLSAPTKPDEVHAVGTLAAQPPLNKKELQDVARPNLARRLSWQADLADARNAGALRV